MKNAIISIMKNAIISIACAAAILCSAARASDDELRKAIYDCVVKDMGGQAKYDSFVRATDNRYKDWANNNNDMSFKVFLDNKLLEKAPAVKGGEVKPLKEFLQWLSLYYAKDEPFPSYADKISDQDRADMKEMLVPDTFDWKRVSEFIKRKAKEFTDKGKKDEKTAQATAER